MWACSHALIHIGSRRHGRALVEIVRAKSSIHVRQAAIYAIWLLGETRAEAVLIRVGADVEGEDPDTRLMAVEALGITGTRRATQAALAAHLFDDDANRLDVEFVAAELAAQSLSRQDRKSVV